MPQHTNINLELGKESYQIIIGDNLLPDSNALYSQIQTLKPSNIVFVTNDSIKELYFNKLLWMQDIAPIHCISIQDGEKYKNWNSLYSIYDFLLDKKCGRDTLIVALGGGVVGDVTGFAAATYQRGTSYIQIPTTLLAQVDSSVGGKTAINHELGKNMIGAFYQPKIVVIDTNTLNTLDSRQVAAGIAEIIKYSLINNLDFFIWLEKNISKLIKRDKNYLQEAITISCQQKAKIVEADEKEQGSRALLNLGHSFGHAIERFTGFNKWLHGEAVAAGMVCAARVSKYLGFINENDLYRITALINKAGLPTELPDGLTPKIMTDYLHLDKKNRNNKLRLILMKSLGESVITDKVQADELQEILSTIK